MQVVQVSPALLGCIYRVHQCKCVGSLCYFADVSKIGQYTAGCSAFCPLYRFTLGALPLRYGSISRFKGVFSAVCGVCVGLCGLWALRGLWGFVRVWS